MNHRATAEKLLNDLYIQRTLKVLILRRTLVEP